MKCLTCPDSTLAITERSGVEIDYCPTCRGVWLDRGELDKIIERAAEPPRREDRYDDDRDRGRYDDRSGYGDRDRYERDRYDDRSGYPRKKKKSFLEDIFDF
ncbi:MAG: zf-TFIIB domain-containing protein [Acidimicrobiia bacterium]